MGQVTEAFVRDMPEIDNPQYLLELLKGTEKKYYKEKRQELLRQGFLPGAMMEQFLYGSVLHRRYTIAEEMLYEKAKREGVAKSLQINRDSIKKLNDLAAQNHKVFELMVKAKLEADKKKEIVDLHAEILEKTEQFVKEHTGEFSFRCKKCGNLVHADGLPIEGVLCERNNEGERVYYVWNPHMEYLLKNRKITIAQMAFMLRTSILGLEYTYKRRTGEPLEKLIKYNRRRSEKELAAIMEEFDEEGNPKRK